MEIALPVIMPDSVTSLLRFIVAKEHLSIRQIFHIKNILLY